MCIFVVCVCVCAFSRCPSMACIYVKRTKRHLMNSTKVLFDFRLKAYRPLNILQSCKWKRKLSQFRISFLKQIRREWERKRKKISTHRIAVCVCVGIKVKNASRKRSDGQKRSSAQKMKKKKSVGILHSREILYCSLASFTAHLYQQANAEEEEDEESEKKPNVWIS